MDAVMIKEWWKKGKDHCKCQKIKQQGNKHNINCRMSPQASRWMTGSGTTIQLWRINHFSSQTGGLCSSICNVCPHTCGSAWLKISCSLFTVRCVSNVSGSQVSRGWMRVNHPYSSEYLLNNHSCIYWLVVDIFTLCVLHAAADSIVSIQHQIGLLMNKELKSMCKEGAMD